MNLFHHEEPQSQPVGPISNFKAPITHGEARTSSFAKGKAQTSEETAASQFDSSAPPIVQTGEESGPKRIGNVSSTSIPRSPANQPSLFGGQGLGMGGAVIVGYDLFGNPIYGQNQGDQMMNNIVQGAAAGVAAGAVMDIVGDVLGGLFNQ